MSCRSRIASLFISAPILCARVAFGEPAAAPQPPAKTAERIDVESTSLEELLDLNLEDQLGRADAASRKTESVLRAPATVTTIDRSQVKLSGATTIPDRAHERR